MITSGYVHPFTDFGFKKIFGEQQSLVSLRAFLNTLLPDEHQIATLEFHQNEFAARTVQERRAVFDLYCKSSDGVAFIVELQKQRQTYFKDRSLYYTTFPIQQQAQKGEWDFQLDPVYCIGVLDFRFDDSKTDEVIHHVRLKDQNNQVFIDKLNLIFLEVPNFALTLEECETSQEKWLYALKHMHALEEVPEEFEGVEGLPEAFELASMPMMTEQEYAAYQQSLKVYRDNKNVLDTAIEEAHTKGFKEGQAGMQAEVDDAKAEVENAKAEAEQAKAQAEQAKTQAENAQAKLEQGLAQLIENGMSEVDARKILGI